MAIEKGDKRFRLGLIGSGYGMNGVTQETQKEIVGSGQQIQVAIIKYPIVVPIGVRNPMLPDVANECVEMTVHLGCAEPCQKIGL